MTNHLVPDEDAGLLAMLATVSTLLQEGQVKAAIGFYRGIAGVDEESAETIIRKWTRETPVEHLQQLRGFRWLRNAAR